MVVGGGQWWSGVVGGEFSQTDCLLLSVFGLFRSSLKTELFILAYPTYDGSALSVSSDVAWVIGTQGGLQFCHPQKS